MWNLSYWEKQNINANYMMGRTKTNNEGTKWAQKTTILITIDNICGSEKQVKWALSIKKDLTNRINQHINKISSKSTLDDRDNKNLIALNNTLKYFNSTTWSAEFYIDMKDRELKNILTSYGV